MTPEERRQFKEMQRMVKAMYEVADTAFIGNLERRLNFLSSTFSLSDATDGPDETPSTGEVLKWDGDRYNPATDNTS